MDSPTRRRKSDHVLRKYLVVLIQVLKQLVFLIFLDLDQLSSLEVGITVFVTVVGFVDSKVTWRWYDDAIYLPSCLVGLIGWRVLMVVMSVCIPITDLLPSKVVRAIVLLKLHPFWGIARDLHCA